MSLPQINVPKYACTLPLLNKSVEYRPYLVKEKKILMMAKEEGTDEAILNAVKQIIFNCTYEKVKAENLPILDLQYLFLKIRSKSVGEIVEFSTKCSHCQKKKDLFLNLEEVKIEKNPNHKNKIMIDNKIGLTLKYPDLEFDKVLNSNDPESKKEINFVINSIESIFDENEVYLAKETPFQELQQFVENLSEAHYKKISEFYSTMPTMKHKIEFLCENCQKTNILEFNNIFNFFA